LKCKSIIEIEKELRKEKQEKNGPFVPVARPGTPGTAFTVGKSGQQGFPNRDKLAIL